MLPGITDRRREVRRGQPISLLGVVACAIVLLGGLGKHLFVPPDQSLPISQYRALGVPELDHAWSGEEHAHAVTILGKIERTELPRYGSYRSRRLFDRLVESQEAMINSIWENAQVTADILEASQAAPIVGRLYEPSSEDNLFFDRELLEIYSEALRSRIEGLEAVAAKNRDLRILLERENDEAKRRRINSLVESDRALIEDHGILVGLALLNLLKLSEVEAAREETRLLLRDRLAELVPRAILHLSERRVGAVATTLREFASLEANAAIRSDLLSLAVLVETHDR